MSRVLLLSLLSVCAFCYSPAQAEDLIPAKKIASSGAVVEAVTSEELPQKSAYPMMRLTPDKLEMVRFDQDAISVLVGNPNHLNVVLDTPRSAVLIPRAPGASAFTVLNAKGEVIMERHVIVASPKQDYVRVRRSCANAEDKGSCKEYSVFFCPDMCHKVAIQQDVDPNRVIDMPEETPGVGPVANAVEGADVGSIPDPVAQPAADPSLPPPPPEEVKVDDNTKLN